MTKMNILIDMPVYESGLEALKAIPGVTVRLVNNPADIDRPLPAELLQDCDALFCTIPPTNLIDATQLKFIQISSAGYTQLLGRGLNERHIRAANALGVFDVPIAEWNIAMMVNMARDMRGMIQNQDAGHWDRSARFQREIRGSVVGIWGYGGLGRETARLAKALGMKVHVLARSIVGPRKDVYCVPGTGDPAGVLPDKVFGTQEKNSFLQGLDYLVLAMPQTPANVGLLGENELRQMKDTAFLLNPARGPLVQEQALVAALENHIIAGAALDTHYYYPMPAEHPLWGMPNVIMTPHIAGSSLSPRFLERVWDIFVQNMQRLTSGKPLLNELLPDKLDGH
jgi:phosphoglycerate dehydrogenase-like enzyme